MAFQRIELAGLGFDPITEEQVVEHVGAALDAGHGGRIVTPNVDIARQAGLPEVAGYLADADLVVADGMPLIWASRLAGTPLPERVAGASLIWSLSALADAQGRGVFLLGGEPGEDSGARRAAAALGTRWPELRVVGAVSPPYRFDADPDRAAALRAQIVAARPDLVFVGLGFPRQEQFIGTLRGRLPGAWFLGCGAAINFVAGDRVRAPAWMQRAGLEWLHRLASEPHRLADRYLRQDAPYALRLLAGAMAARYARG